MNFLSKAELELSDEMLGQLHQIHVINLDRSPQRWEMFQKLNAHIKNAVRVSAVDGTDIDRQDYIDRGEITEDLPYGPGTLACAMSHIGLWRQAAGQNRVMTIMEDDVMISRHFEAQTARLIATLPSDWDIIQWGFVLEPLFVWLDLGFTKAELRFYGSRLSVNPRSFQAWNSSPNAMRLAHSFGTQAYSVSPKGADTLLKSCRPLRKQLISFPERDIRIEDVGLDCTLNGLYGKMQAYVSLPPLVIPIPDQQSDRIATGH